MFVGLSATRSRLQRSRMFGRAELDDSSNCGFATIKHSPPLEAGNDDRPYYKHFAPLGLGAGLNAACRKFELTRLGPETVD
jgi:hypothetical protein